MSLFTKLLLLLLALGLAGIFILKQPNGQPYLPLGNFIPQGNIITSRVEQVLPDATMKQTETVYRWKETNGTWQFSDKVPKRINAEEIMLRTHSNSDIAPPAPLSVESEPSMPTASPIFIDDNKPITTGIGTTASPESIKQLMEEAKNIKDLFDTNDERIREALQ